MSSRKRWMKIVCVGIWMWNGLYLIAADPVVSNVRATQRTGTSLFDITYDLADADTTNLSVTVNISTNNGVSWFTPASSNLTGAVGMNAISPGNNHAIVWRGGRELPAQLFPFVNVKITADDAPPLYLIVNLSGGTNVTSYSVTYLNSTPIDGWTDEYKTTKLVMRRIDPGTFTMGSSDAELGRGVDETQHMVTQTKSFYMGVFELTQRQWELVMGNRPSYYLNTTYYATRPVESVSYLAVREIPPNSDDPTVGWPTNSAVNVSSFMGKLRAKTGMSTFDLPTESQWEYACRAGTETSLNSGKNLTSIEDVCLNMSEVGRYNKNCEPYPAQSDTTNKATTVVGSYLPNQWGLYDMHGNVWEWCLDWYGAAYPENDFDPVGLLSGTTRVIRGGSFGNYARSCRSAERMGYTDSHQSVGFRVCKTQP